MLEKFALLKVIRFILSNPLTKYSITQVAKETKIAISAAKYCLDELFKAHLVTLDKVGKTHQYQANLDNPISKQWKILFSLQDISKGKIAEHILKNVKNISSIVLYGSVAQGIDDPKSDVDILVIADTDKTNVSIPNLNGKEVFVHIYSPVSWRKKAVSDKIFYEQVILYSVPLYGTKPVVL